MICSQQTRCGRAAQQRSVRKCMHIKLGSADADPELGFNPAAESSPMPWGASSIHSDRSSIISQTNQKRRRRSMLSNPDSPIVPQDDLSRILSAADKSHRRRSSDSNLRRIHSSLSATSVASPIANNVPLSPRMDLNRASFETPNPSSPILPSADNFRFPLQAPRMGSFRNSMSLEAWEEGDSFEDSAAPKQTSASRFAQATLSARPAVPAVPALRSPTPDGELRSQAGIVGLGEGWAGGPQRDSKGKKVKASKLAAGDPLALWNQEAEPGPSHSGLKSTSVRSFWGRSMQNLGLSRPTHETHMEAWGEDALAGQATVGDKARRLLARLNSQSRPGRASKEIKENRRRSLAVFNFSPITPVPVQAPSASNRIPQSPSTPSLVSLSRHSSRISRRAASPFSSCTDLPIPQRRSSLTLTESSHPFLRPSPRPDNLPGGLPPPWRARVQTPSQPPTVVEAEEGPSSSSSQAASSVLRTNLSTKQDRGSKHRRSMTFGVADIASEIERQDATDIESPLDPSHMYMPMDRGGAAHLVAEERLVPQRRRSVLNRLKNRVSASSVSSGASAIEVITPRSVSQASDRPDPIPKPRMTSSSSWRQLSLFNHSSSAESPKLGATIQVDSPRKPSKSRALLFMDNLRSPSTPSKLRLSSWKKRDSTKATTPKSVDSPVAEYGVQDVPFSSTSTSDVTPPDSVESFSGTPGERLHALRRLSRLSERDGEGETDDGSRRTSKSKSPYALDVDLGGKGLNLAAMLASCDDLSARLDADVAFQRAFHTRSASTSAVQVNQPTEGSHSRNHSAPVDLVGICAAADSADSLSAVADTRLNFPLPPKDSPPSPDTDHLEELSTPHYRNASLYQQEPVSVPKRDRKLSANSTDRLRSSVYRRQSGDLLSMSHRTSDAGSVVSLRSSEASDLEYGESFSSTCFLANFVKPNLSKRISSQPPDRLGTRPHNASHSS